MRLVCPNCEAKYEVPEDAIPDTGRDVQCASCGHAWFQMRPRATTAVPAAPVAAEPPAPPQVAETVAPEAAAEAIVEASAEPVGEPEADPPPLSKALPEPEQVAPEPGPVASELADEPDLDLLPEPEATLEAERTGAAYAPDDNVLAILREEAEREANARRSETRTLETQTDLGLEGGPAAIEAEPAPASAEVETKPAPRRDLLPDVEEINSTLRPSETVEDVAAEAMDLPSAAQSSPGFRGGFLTVMAVSILAAAVYLAAPHLGGLIPSLVGPLDAYVGYIDGLRLALDGMMRSATVALNGS